MTHIFLFIYYPFDAIERERMTREVELLRLHMRLWIDDFDLVVRIGWRRILLGGIADGVGDDRTGREHRSYPPNDGDDNGESKHEAPQPPLGSVLERRVPAVNSLHEISRNEKQVFATAGAERETVLVAHALHKKRSFAAHLSSLKQSDEVHDSLHSGSAKHEVGRSCQHRGRRQDRKKPHQVCHPEETARL